ncbi:MAG TPA: hypothetical protein VNH11_08135 [Pirellulales bacterium]|nr:hypothetical protein [Pirellulales bacterium]
MRPRIGLLTPLAVFGWLALGLTGQSVAVEALQLEVGETAGIRRFGYPIALTLPELPLDPASARFRLCDGDKRVPAQFRREQTPGGAALWWLDFNVSLMPNEVRTLTLEYGPDVAADAEPRGLELKQTPDGFVIRNGAHLTWTVGRDLLGLLKSVDAGELRHLRPEGVRLEIEGANGVLCEMRDETVSQRVIRSGPLAVAVRYEFTPNAGPFAEMKSTVDLTFPVSKSWVQVDWQIDDPRHAVRSARAEIAQNLGPPTDQEPTLIDFGASSLVYLSLEKTTAGKLHARMAAPDSKAPRRQSWEVLRGAPDRLEPFVTRSPMPQSGDAEGWAHIMDRHRCLALAVDQFGRDGDDSIEIAAEGHTSLVRRFATGGAGLPTSQRFRFWLHFVGFPPHLTAATSPQSMLSPLVVRISKP